jgi:hypothetical protein
VYVDVDVGEVVEPRGDEITRRQEPEEPTTLFRCYEENTVDVVDTMSLICVGFAPPKARSAMLLVLRTWVSIPMRDCAINRSLAGTGDSIAVTDIFVADLGREPDVIICELLNWRFINGQLAKEFVST